MAIFFTFLPTSNHLHPLQVENCDSNSRLVVDEDDNGKFRPESVNICHLGHTSYKGRLKIYPLPLVQSLLFVFNIAPCFFTLVSAQL